MRMIPIEFLVPQAYRQWRPVVSDGLQYIFTHLSEQRLADKILEQAALPASTPAEVRLIRLISKMPGLQKVGQILARNRRLSPALRNALKTPENGISDVAVEEIRSIIAEQLHTRLRRYRVNVEQ